MRGEDFIKEGPTKDQQSEYQWENVYRMPKTILNH